MLNRIRVWWYRRQLEHWAPEKRKAAAEALRKLGYLPASERNRKEAEPARRSPEREAVEQPPRSLTRDREEAEPARRYQEQEAVIEPCLTSEEQSALFCPMTALMVAKNGNAECLGFGPDGTSAFVSHVSQETAQWAFPWATRIFHAEEHFKDGDVLEALFKFKEIQASLPDAAVVLIKIGLCYAELGHHSQARSWLEDSLLTVPPEHREFVEGKLRQLESQ